MGAYALAASIALPVLGGIIVSGATRENLTGWYTTLRKPAWCPPGALFGPAWGILYTLIGIAAYQIYQVGGCEIGSRAFTLYGVQLALNFLWPLVFFNMKATFLSVIVNIALLVTATATTGQFYKLRPEAGQLMLPYVAWLIFANLLNIVIWRMNPHAADQGVKDATIAADEKVVKADQQEGYQQKEEKPRNQDKYGPLGPNSPPAAAAMPIRTAHRMSNPQPTVHRPLLRAVRPRPHVNRAAPSLHMPRAAAVPASARAIC